MYVYTYIRPSVTERKRNRPTTVCTQGIYVYEGREEDALTFHECSAQSSRFGDRAGEG